LCISKKQKLEAGKQIALFWCVFVHSRTFSSRCTGRRVLVQVCCVARQKKYPLPEGMTNVNKFFSDAVHYSEKITDVISAGDSFKSLFQLPLKRKAHFWLLGLSLKPPENSLFACRTRHPVLQLIPV